MSARRALRVATMVSALALLTGSAAPPTARVATPQARITGLVYDSVSHVTLRGALVQLVATGSGGDPVRLGTLTDSTGRFTFPAVARGRFVLGFFHPKLDSLGMEAPLTTLHVAGGGDLAVDLAVPSTETVLRATCGNGTTRDSSGAVLGFVRNAAAALSLPGVDVRARWSEISIGARTGARVLVRESTARTGADGWFALCRVPAGGLVLVNAGVAGDSGATLEVQVPNDGLLVRDLFVPAPAPASSLVRGTVRDPYGEPIPGARVRLWGDARETRSNARGEFTLAGIPTGTRMLELRAIGYAPRRELVDLMTRREVVVDLPLEEFPTAIDTLRIVGGERRENDRLAGFARRKALSHGVFLDPEAIERRRPLNFTDLLRGISGVEILQVLGARAAVMRSIDGTGPCEPELVVDGARVPRYDSSIDDLIPASIVQAIEVYPRRIQAPAEYQSLDCGSIIVWTGARGWLSKRGGDGARSHF